MHSRFSRPETEPFKVAEVYFHDGAFTYVIRGYLLRDLSNREKMYHEETFVSVQRFKDIFRINFFKYFRKIDKYLDKKRNNIYSDTFDIISQLN